MINTHPLRAKEGGSGWSNVAYVFSTSCTVCGSVRGLTEFRFGRLCFSALFASYIPLFIITNTPKV
jgi:hypothetical protein